MLRTAQTLEGFASITWRQHALQSKVSVNKRAPVVMKFKCIDTVFYESWRYKLLKKNEMPIFCGKFSYNKETAYNDFFKSW